ncbi:MAG: HlyD family efflux transporter periplasmic adaptor subunit [Synechococcaceae cyanobacterium]|nr:HlyD family efflux transporter periplasmic adaptor subunit [Synechococcaceae cyanobacterium]
MVAALGRLVPAGDVRVLAAPIAGIGGSPRISLLLVEEGDRVSRGQLLARFDTAPAQRAQQSGLRSRISVLERRLGIEQREIQRYRKLRGLGALAADELDRREQDLLQLQGQLLESRAELQRVNSDLVNTELRAPFSGTVLRLHARSGERPSERGILELGANDRMEALIEVYESDIGRVKTGQRVQMTSENGGFSGRLMGTVVRVAPQVRQREVLSTDPTGDADARIVEVRVRIDPQDLPRVRDLAGLKVIARLQS